MNDGIPVAFFGRPAMTAPALAQFALRFRSPIIPVRVVRLEPARFRMVCEPPLAVPLTADRRADVHALTGAVNATLERWIRADPAAWLWLHRRWPKEPPEPPGGIEVPHANGQQVRRPALRAVHPLQQTAIHLWPEEFTARPSGRRATDETYSEPGTSLWALPWTERCRSRSVGCP